MEIPGTNGVFVAIHGQQEVKCQLDCDDDQSENADTEVNEISEENDLEKQTPILENDYIPDENYELDNDNKEQEDTVEIFKDSLS